MELIQEQKARNSAGSKKELEVFSVQESKSLTISSDDFELNDEQLEAAAGGVYIDGSGIIGSEDGGGCTKPKRP